MMRNLIDGSELSSRDFTDLFVLAAQMKDMASRGESHRYLEGKTISLYMEKPTLESLVSFNIAMAQLGGTSVYIDPDALKSTAMSYEDTGRVLSIYSDIIGASVNGHKDIRRMEKGTSVPLVNIGTDLFSPCGVLADLFTMRERKGELEGRKIGYIGVGNNVCNSLLLCAARLGMDFTLACPAECKPPISIQREAKEIGKETGSEIVIATGPRRAVRDADVVYYYYPMSLGEQAAKHSALAASKYKITNSLLKLAKKDHVFMTPTPTSAYIGKGITDGINSAVWQQVENNLHVKKALLTLIVK